MNFATTIEIRATFDTVKWGEPVCPNCASPNITPPRNPSALHTCDSCNWAFDYLGGDSDDYTERAGWADPANPWGSFEQDGDDDSCPPASVSLPFAEALEFLIDFPGGIWGHRESESEQNMRTGEYKRVTAHVPDEWEDILFAALNVVDPKNWGPQY